MASIAKGGMKEKLNFFSFRCLYETSQGQSILAQRPSTFILHLQGVCAGSLHEKELYPWEIIAKSQAGYN